MSPKPIFLASRPVTGQRSNLRFLASLEVGTVHDAADRLRLRFVAGEDENSPSQRTSPSPARARWMRGRLAVASYT